MCISAYKWVCMHVTYVEARIQPCVGSHLSAETDQAASCAVVRYRAEVLI